MLEVVMVVSRLEFGPYEELVVVSSLDEGCIVDSSDMSIPMYSRSVEARCACSSFWDFLSGHSLA